MKNKHTLLVITLMVSMFYFAQTNSEFNSINSAKSKVSRLIKLGKIHHPKNQFRANKQVLDSMIYLESDDSLNQLHSKEKYIYSYDSLKRKTSEIEYEWDKYNNAWKAGDKEELFYANNNYLVLSKDYKWDDSLNTWANCDYKKEYTYDSNGNLTIEASYYLENNLWANAEKKEYTYDQNNNMLINFNLLGDSANWDTTATRIYSYDLNNNLTEQIWSYINITGDSLELREKEEYTYDSVNNKTEFILSLYNGGSWQQYNNTTYNYNSNNKLIEKIEYYSIDSLWANSQKTASNYDSFNNLSEEVVYSWDEDSSQWINAYKIGLTYNNNYSFTDLVLPFATDDFSDEDGFKYFNHLLDEINIFIYDSANNESLYQKYMLHYTLFNALDIFNQEESSVKIFPNPTSDYLNFSLQSNSNSNNFELYDINGRKVMASTIRSGEQLNMSHLTEGIYLYNINIDGNRQSGEIVKR